MPGVSLGSGITYRGQQCFREWPGKGAFLLPARTSVSRLEFFYAYLGKAEGQGYNPIAVSADALPSKCNLLGR